MTAQNGRQIYYHFQEKLYELCLLFSIAISGVNNVMLIRQFCVIRRNQQYFC